MAATSGFAETYLLLPLALAEDRWVAEKPTKIAVIESVAHSIGRGLTLFEELSLERVARALLHATAQHLPIIARSVAEVRSVLGGWVELEIRDLRELISSVIEAFATVRQCLLVIAERCGKRFRRVVEPLAVSSISLLSTATDALRSIQRSRSLYLDDALWLAGVVSLSTSVAALRTLVAIYIALAWRERYLSGLAKTVDRLVEEDSEIHKFLTRVAIAIE